MGLSRRRADFTIAAAIVAVAVVVSPIGIRLATGRLDLSSRINLLSLTFVLFLLILAGAGLTWGRARYAAFYLLAWTFPLVLLAAIEIGAIAVHLADRIAPLEDLSILANKDRWPPNLMSAGRQVEKDGVRLYRRWRGDGISINELGLRTAMPSPKDAGEWRIAVSGGSAAWGWRVLDADTIPVQMQQILRKRGYSNVTVYNFAIDSMAITQELSVLKRFRDTYAIDHVVFYTGANDSTRSYMSEAVRQDRFGELLNGANAFELIKVAGRLKAKVFEPPPDLLARLDNGVLPELARNNSLKDGLTAANEYCRALTIRCDVVLQPMLLTRNQPHGSEIRLARTLKQIYPRYRELVESIYRSTLNTGLPIHDRYDLFDQSGDPYFFDAVHVNEAGNRFAAERIVEIVAGGIPSPARSREHTSIIRR
jgi:GDSL-like Lipase/Acylhydrolase